MRLGSRGWSGPAQPVLGGCPVLYPHLEGEGARAGSAQGHLAELFREAGLAPTEDTSISVSVEHATFEEWWEPFTLGVGTVGSFITTRNPDEMVALREACRAILPPAPFTITARAWTSSRGSEAQNVQVSVTQGSGAPAPADRYVASAAAFSASVPTHIP